MEFNKDIFLEYFKSQEINEHDRKYIYKLYKNYELINSITDGKIEQNKNKLREFEDKIYTVDGNLLTDKQRIELAVNSISEVMKNDSLNNYRNFNILNEISGINCLDLRDEKNISLAKKKISIMQAQLGLKNTFFYDACQAFNEIYMNSFISYMEKKTNRK